MIPPPLLRVSCGLLAALFTAVLVKFVLFDWGTLNASGQTAFFSSLQSSFSYVLKYALLLAILTAIASELLRLRHIAVHIASGVAVALIAAQFSIRGEPLTSAAFAGGALTGLSVLAVGVLSSLAYWGVAGRRAGWLGDAAERSQYMSGEAFRTASANANVDYCRQCLAGWSALGLFLFALLGWLSINTSGLRYWLIAETVIQAETVLADAGYAWAKFKVEGDRGIVEGLAPDEVEKRAAFDTVREALVSVTGFPGILARVDNAAVARMPMSAVSKQLAEATKRETEAKVAIEAAKLAADSARTAESEARLKFETQTEAVRAEAKRMGEEQTRAAEAELKRKFDEQVHAAEEKARLAAAAAAAATAQAAATTTIAKAEPAPPQAPAVETPAPPAVVASLETGPQADDDSNTSPGLDPPTAVPSGACTSQDLALIESSSILFDNQAFDVVADYNSELDRLAASAQACGPRAVLVSGRADNSSDSLFNRSLGLQRAQSVRDALIARGVAATAVMAQAEAKTMPTIYDTGAPDRGQNRRADFRLLEASETSRDATLRPDERATTCESDLAEIMSHSTIYFPTASARIGGKSMAVIKKLASAIETCGSVIVTVEGHTDKVGTTDYNQGLSEARANTVRETLVVSGANPTRIASRGFASDRPSDTGDTAEALALNRRIEFKVSGKFTSTNAGGP